MSSIHDKYDADYIIKNVPLYDVPLYDKNPLASDDFFKKLKKSNENNQIIGKTILITIVVIMILLIFLMWISDGSKKFSFSIIFLGGLFTALYYIDNFNINEKYRGLFNNSRKIEKNYHHIKWMDFSKNPVLEKDVESRKNICKILYVDE